MLRVNSIFNLRTTIKFVSVFCIALAIQSCAVKPVQIIKITNADVKNILSQPTIEFEIALKNPNNFGVTFKKMELNLVAGDKVLVRLASEKQLRMAKHSSISLPVELHPSVKDITDIVSTGFSSLLSGKSSQKMELQGEILVKKFIFTKTLKLKEPIKF